MTIRRKTLLLIAIVLFALTACIVTLAGIVLLNRARKNDANQARRKIQRALVIISNEVATLDRMVNDYAAWDDTCAFVAEPDNSAFLENNFGDETLAKNRFGFVLIADAEGRFLFRKAVDLEQGAAMEFPDGLSASLHPDSPLLRHEDAESGVAGMLDTSDGPYLIASRPILDSDYRGPVRGTLIAGRPLDSREIERIANIALLSLVLRRPTEIESAACRDALLSPGGISVSLHDGDTLCSGVLLHDLQGRSALILSNMDERGYYKQALRDLLALSIFLVLICATATGLSLVILDRAILSRLEQLHRFVGTIGAPGSLSSRIALGGHDEFAELGGTLNRMLSALETDLVERKKAEASLRKQEALLRSVIDGHPGFVWVKDRHSRFMLVNRGLAHYCNTTQEAMIGKLDSDFNPSPAEAMRFRQEDEHVFETGKPHLIPEEKVTDLSGNPRWISTYKIPMFDEHGRCDRVMAIALDITDRKNAEEARRQSEERYRGVYEAAPLAFVLWDREFRVLDWNRQAERIFGWSREEVMGRNFFEFLIPDSDLDTVKTSVELILQGKLPSHAINKNLTKDGRVITCEWNNAIQRDAEGLVVGAISLGVDITDRLKAEEDRRHLDSMMQQTQKLESLGVLAGGIAHDFNNILVSILGNADLALSELPVEAPTRPIVQDIVVGARRAAELCHQMLAYSGRGRFLIEPLDLTALVREMGHMLEVAISKKVLLRYHFADRLPAVEGDATQLRQVVMNLIINASEAIGERSGVVGVTTGAMDCDASFLRQCILGDKLAAGLFVYVEVADTGCGLDAATIRRIFDPFFTTKFTGRGLGLAAVLGIVSGHHGAIHVQSTPGEGTTFRVLFPASAKQTVAGTPTTAQSPRWRGRGTVLVVDDEETVRALTHRMLESCGLTVLTAADGRAGVELFQQKSGAVDCILLDLTMPHMDGAETLAELKRIRPDVAIVLSSGYTEQDVMKRVKGADVAGFVEKPYTRASLTAVLRKILPEAPASPQGNATTPR